MAKKPTRKAQSRSGRKRATGKSRSESARTRDQPAVDLPLFHPAEQAAEPGPAATVPTAGPRLDAPPPSEPESRPQPEPPAPRSHLLAPQSCSSLSVSPGLILESPPAMPPVPSIASVPALDVPPKLDVRLADRVLPARALLLATACLLGLAAGLGFQGVQTICAAEIDPLPATATMVTVIALLAVASGMGLRRGPWESSRPRFSSPAERQARTSMPGSTVAFTSAAAGVLMLVAVLASRPVLQFYRGLLDQFFWTNLSLAALEWMVAALLVVGPGLALGYALATLKGEFAAAPAGTSTPVQGGLLLGVAVSLLLPAGPLRELSAERLMIAATLPLFTISAYILLRSARSNPLPGPPAPTGPCYQMPVSIVARAAPPAWAFAASIACAGWGSCRPVGGDGWPLLLNGAVLVGLMAAGRLGAAAIWARRAEPPLGPTIWLCGLGAGLAATLAVWYPAAWSSQCAEAALLGLTLGVALYAISAASEARAACRAYESTRLATLLLIGAAIGVAASRWWALPQLGAMGTLAAGSLGLLALGGLLELYAEQPARGQRFYLALVFSSLAAAIILFPMHTRTWTRRDHRQTASLDSSACPVLPEMLAGVRTACLIGVDPRMLAAWPAGRSAHVEVLPLAAWRPKPTPSRRGDRVHVVSMPAPRALRLSHARYQLIYQRLQPPHDDPNVYGSIEWLSRLRRHLAAGGTLVLDLPLTGNDLSSVAADAATFRQVWGPECSWAVPDPDRPRLLLRFGPGWSHPHLRSQTVWKPLDTLLASHASRRHIRSIRNGLR